MTVRRHALVLVIPLAALALAACGDSETHDKTGDARQAAQPVAVAPTQMQQPQQGATPQFVPQQQPATGIARQAAQPVAVAPTQMQQPQQGATPQFVPQQQPATGIVQQTQPPAHYTAQTTGGQQLTIVDAQGFGQPLVAATVQAPAGWQAEGGIGWDRGQACITNQLRIQWVASAPDGREAFEIMHPFAWQLQGRAIQMNPCPVLPFASLRDFLVAVVQQRRPGARMLGYLDRPEIAAQAESRAPPVQQGWQRKIEVGEIMIAYPAQGGEIQERLWTSATFTTTQGSVMGTSGTVYGHRRLGGAPDPALGDRIAGSMQLNPQWVALVNDTNSRFVQQQSDAQSAQIQQWHAREMARINAQGMADRAAIRSQTQRDIATINAQTYANTQATNDGIHRRNLEAIGEYNTYSNTSGDPVRSSIHGGDRVFQHPDGSYSSTNNPYYQPPGGVELQRVR